jgi:hypothetical protein
MLSVVASTKNLTVDELFTMAVNNLTSDKELLKNIPEPRTLKVVAVVILTGRVTEMIFPAEPVSVQVKLTFATQNLLI